MKPNWKKSKSHMNSGHECKPADFKEKDLVTYNMFSDSNNVLLFPWLCHYIKGFPMARSIVTLSAVKMSAFSLNVVKVNVHVACNGQKTKHHKQSKVQKWWPDDLKSTKLIEGSSMLELHPAIASLWRRKRASLHGERLRVTAVVLSDARW